MVITGKLRAHWSRIFRQTLSSRQGGEEREFYLARRMFSPSPLVYIPTKFGAERDSQLAIATASNAGTGSN